MFYVCNTQSLPLTLSEMPGMVVETRVGSILVVVVVVVTGCVRSVSRPSPSLRARTA